MPDNGDELAESQYCFALRFFLRIMNATLTPMNIIVSMLGMDAQLSSIAQGAALLAFPDAIVRTRSNLEGALKGELASACRMGMDLNS